MRASHIDEQRHRVLVEYLTSGRDGDPRASRMHPAGATASEKRGIRQQAATFVWKDRLLSYRATDVVNEISLKRVIANKKEKARIMHTCHDGV